MTVSCETGWLKKIIKITCAILSTTKKGCHLQWNACSSVSVYLFSPMKADVFHTSISSAVQRYRIAGWRAHAIAGCWRTIFHHVGLASVPRACRTAVFPVSIASQGAWGTRLDDRRYSAVPVARLRNRSGLHVWDVLTNCACRAVRGSPDLAFYLTLTQPARPMRD